MNESKLLDLIQMGESSQVQFKIRVTNANAIGVEMVALANTKGGRIIIGVDDKTAAINGLSFAELQVTNALLANAAANNVKAPCLYLHGNRQGETTKPYCCPHSGRRQQATYGK